MSPSSDGTSRAARPRPGVFPPLGSVPSRRAPCQRRRVRTARGAQRSGQPAALRGQEDGPRRSEGVGGLGDDVVGLVHQRLRARLVVGGVVVERVVLDRVGQLVALVPGEDLLPGVGVMSSVGYRWVTGTFS